MRDVTPWSQYFFQLAQHVSTRSKDPSTQVGAIVVSRDGRVLCTGYNGMPAAMKETSEDWERPQKYDRVIHAEMNAIAQAARHGGCLNKTTIYVTHFPCLECAKLIVSAGIETVVYGQPVHGWDDSHEKALNLFLRSGVTLVEHTSEIQFQAPELDDPDGQEES